jgi:hypothetical protein
MCCFCPAGRSMAGGPDSLAESCWIPTFWSFLRQTQLSMLANMMIYVIWESYLEKKLVPTLVSWQLDPENKLFLVETNLPSPFSGTMLIYWWLLTNIKADAIHILIIYGNSSLVVILQVISGPHQGTSWSKCANRLSPWRHRLETGDSRKFAIQEPNLQMWIS